MGKKLTTKQFVQNMQKVHKDLYNYSRVEYNGAYIPITVICKVHGEFITTPSNHSKGSGCQACANEATSKRCKKTVVTFKIEATVIHNNFYNYDKVIYETARLPIIITCKIHGDFKQIPSNHLKGVGCPSCHGGMYNASKETLLYYLSINEGQAYKIGITCKSVNERFITKDLLKIEVLKIWIFKTGLDAYNVEQKILKQFKNNQYKGKKLLESGNTELFNKNILNEIQGVLDA